MNAPDGSLLQVLQAQLRQGPLSHAADIAVGFSGGLDSHVLLHALQVLRQQTCEVPSSSATLPFQRIRALHIHHGLSPNADAWRHHCEQVSLELGVPLTVHHVTVARKVGQSLEEQARLARYAAFAHLLKEGEQLLLAHHQDDQAETLLLRLLRGSGPQGLSAIPVNRALGRGALWRPLLSLPRADLEHYAREAGLHWISDESNDDVAFDRNYLRARVLPVIAQRWPGYRQSWQRSANLSAEAHQLARELAAIDLQQCAVGMTLDCAALASLSVPRQRNLIRYWLAEQGMSDPGWEILRRCVEEVVPAREDAQPLLSWDGQQIRRYRNHLYALRALSSPGEPLPIRLDHNALGSGHLRLSLPGNGELQFAATTGQGLRLPLQAEISYRSAGQICRLANRPARPLKKILHEANIPPWLRSRLPLLQINGELACIPGVGCTAEHAAGAGEMGVLVLWKPPQ